MELWGLKEGSYLFQLTVAGSDQRESTSNITVTVLSPKQTEGEEGGGEADPGLTHTLHPAPALPIGPRSSLTSFPSPRILPCIQQGGPLPWFLPPLVLRHHRTDLQEFCLWRLSGQQEQLPLGRRVQARLPQCARWAFVKQCWGSDDIPPG